MRSDQPVCPKPPSPRLLLDSSATSSTAPWTTGAITHLRHTIAGLDDDWILPEIDQQDHDFTAIVRCRWFPARSPRSAPTARPSPNVGAPAPRSRVAAPWPTQWESPPARPQPPHWPVGSGGQVHAGRARCHVVREHSGRAKPEETDRDRAGSGGRRCHGGGIVLDTRRSGGENRRALLLPNRERGDQAQVVEGSNPPAVRALASSPTKLPASGRTLPR